MSTKKRRGRPPLSSDKLKNKPMLVMVDPLEKATFQDAAGLAGISLSTWVRERLRVAAIRELEAAGLDIKLLERLADG